MTASVIFSSIFPAMTNLHQHLLTRFQKGDPASLRDIFELHYREVCSVIYRLVKDKALSEDLAQQVFVRFWEKRSQLQINSSIGAYLRRMAINEAVYHLRKQKEFESEESLHYQADSGDNAEQKLMQQELESKIKSAIDLLPPKCRAVFLLSRYEELSYREIAEQLDISVKTVENQMGKALRFLRDQVRPYLETT